MDHDKVAADFDTKVADEATMYLQEVVAESVGPHKDECLRCYVERMVMTHGCDGSMQFVERWLDARRVPERAVLIRWLNSRGGYCDCEALFNVLHDHWPDTDTEQ